MHSFLTNAIEVQKSSGVMYLHTSVRLGGYSTAFILVYGYISILVSVVFCATCSLTFISFWDYPQYFYILTTCCFVMHRPCDPLEFHMFVFVFNGKMCTCSQVQLYVNVYFMFRVIRLRHLIERPNVFVAYVAAIYT